MRKFFGAMLFTLAFGLVVYAAVISVHDAAKPQKFVYEGNFLNLFPITIEGEIESKQK